MRGFVGRNAKVANDVSTLVVRIVVNGTISLLQMVDELKVKMRVWTLCSPEEVRKKLQIVIALLQDGVFHRSFGAMVQLVHNHLKWAYCRYTLDAAVGRYF